MKRLLFSFLIASFAFMVNAQTIHWLTFIDTTDENVGALDVTGRKVLYSRFINVINAALAEKGFNSDIQDFYGHRTSPENCKRAVESLTCRPNDIVVFYYIGHGGRPVTDDDAKHPFPQMWLAQGDESKMIPLEWVHETLKDKGARLTATIGMCCNVKQNLSIKRAPTFGVSYGNTYLTQEQLTAIQNMFLANRGDFLLSSASPAQPSLGGSTPLGDMDLFTAVLVSVFDEMSEHGELSWDSLFGNVKTLVNDVTEGRQTPIFVSNITKASKSTTVNREEPKKDALNIHKDPNTIGNLLTQYFDFVVDQSQSIEKRIEISENLRKLFSSDAQIKIMSRDGDVVVDKESIDTFLGRMVTSRILLKVMPVAFKATSTQITELKIKEYYKKN